MTEEERERVYLRIEITNFPRQRGEGAAAAADEIARAVAPPALGFA